MRKVRTSKVKLGSVVSLTEDSLKCVLEKDFGEGTYLFRYNSGAVYENRWKYVYLHKEVKEEEKEMEELYTFKRGTRELYCTKLTKNKNNDWVVAIKGTDEYVAVPEKKLSLVMPYTVRIVSQARPNNLHDYLSYEGEFKLGELLIHENNLSICKVTKLDSKSRVAIESFKGYRLTGVEKIVEIDEKD